MKSISNSAFSLLLEKLPIVLRHAATSIPAEDIEALNALRRLAVLHRKLMHTKPLTNNPNERS